MDRLATVLALAATVALGALALDRVADGTTDERGVGLPLDEVVLRSFVERLEGQRLVVRAAQDHHRDVWHGGLEPPQTLQALGVGQREVEQDAVHLVCEHVHAGFGEGDHMSHLEAPGPPVAKHLADQAGVARVVFDEQKGPWP